MWPFMRAKKTAIAGLRDDVFWLTDASRVDGLMVAAARLLASGSHVVLIAHSPERVGRLADAAAFAGLPLDGLDVPAAAPQLLARLESQPEPSLLIALANSLLPSPAASTEPPQSGATVSVLVAERFPLRERDDAVVAFAAALAAASTEIHVSCDDPLLRAFSGSQTEQILRKLGMTDKESITHRMLSGSIERAQGKVAKLCPDPAGVEVWLADRLG